MLRHNLILLYFCLPSVGLLRRKAFFCYFCTRNTSFFVRGSISSQGNVFLKGVSFFELLVSHRVLCVLPGVNFKKKQLITRALQVGVDGRTNQLKFHSHCKSRPTAPIPVCSLLVR